MCLGVTEVKLATSTNQKVIFWYCHGLRMVRKTQSGKSPNKKSRRGDPDSAERHLMFTTYTEPSVHKRNLCIVSYPIIFLFTVLRTLLYQIFVICRFIYCSTSSYFSRNRKLECGNANNEETCIILEEVHEMSQVNKNPGPGDPLLAKQKHHHRRAFEYISKALKIDEENEGKCCLKQTCTVLMFYSSAVYH